MSASLFLPCKEVHLHHSSRFRVYMHCVLACMQSVVSDSLWPPGLGSYQDPLSMKFSRQEYWSGLPFPPPGDLPDPEIEPKSPELAGVFFTTKPPGKPIEWCVFLFLTYFTLYNRLPPRFNWRKFVPFKGWVIFHCIYVPWLYPFLCWWTSRWLLCPGNYKQCCNEHWGTGVF